MPPLASCHHRRAAPSPNNHHHSHATQPSLAAVSTVPPAAARLPLTRIYPSRATKAAVAHHTHHHPYSSFFIRQPWQPVKPNMHQKTKSRHPREATILILVAATHITIFFALPESRVRLRISTVIADHFLLPREFRRAISTHHDSHFSPSPQHRLGLAITTTETRSLYSGNHRHRQTPPSGDLATAISSIDATINTNTTLPSSASISSKPASKTATTYTQKIQTAKHSTHYSPIRGAGRGGGGSPFPQFAETLILGGEGD
ncbi:hypothetical protein LR48_Vigan10g030300 [Vigna angularis]|uniref:Uncharacterized protein n=1 Tax=Phaseolus angularis TaxID=3914 RepID=A0A0L9VH84_PHAAN|nr:hypothetical protein LR48_Vigan10g030300 [Vigna angularis]